MAKENNLLHVLFVAVLFVFFYGVLWVLGVSVFEAWSSPMHWLIPIPAFFLSFLTFNWVEQYFEVSLSRWWVPILIVLLSVLAFVVSAWFYYCNGFTNIYASNTTCDGEGSQRAWQLITTQFWPMLTRDAFFYFGLAVLFGWLAKLIVLRAVDRSPTVQAASVKSRKKK